MICFTKRYWIQGACTLMTWLLFAGSGIGQDQVVIDFEDESLEPWVVVDEPRENLTEQGPSGWEIFLSNLGFDENVLMQSSFISGAANTPNAMGSIIYYGEQEFTDFTLDVDVITTDDDGMGVVWGFNDLDQHYRVMMINQSPMMMASKRISLESPWYEQLGIIRQRDGYIPYPQQIGRPIHWTLEVVGGNFTFTSTDSLTGDEVAISGFDDSYPSGYVGLQVSSQQVVEFDNFTITPIAGAPLHAGDADQDLDVDQLDLVQVQIAAKYLTGQPATWGEGDWNGAPGGGPGNPPAGDGVFNQLDIVAAQQAGDYLRGPYAAVQPQGAANDAQTSVGYHAGSGEVWVDAPAGTELTSINIDSASGIFTGDAAQNLGGSFDNDADNNIFKATFGDSFGTLSFGNVAQAGLSEEFLLNDLTVVGSLAGGGDLGDVDLIYVPEPGTPILLWIGLAVGLLHFRRIGRGLGDAK